MDLLEMKKLFWPPTIQVESLGNKVDLIKRLDLISQKMETQRPKTSPIQRGEPIPRDKVLKRSSSDCGTHVLFPNPRSEIGWDSLEEGPPGSLWVAQEFVPHLRDLGEWRVCIVGGIVLYVVHTRYNSSKGVWTFRAVDRYYSLKEIE
jgi:hypothetical protein